ncbi:MAG: nitroreductase family protein [Dehalococcoidia bacterium]
MSTLLGDDVKCNRCVICVLECPARIITMADPEVLPSWVERGEELCLNCGHCVAVCPREAVGLETMKPEDCAPVNRQLLPSPEQAELLLRSRRSIRSYKETPVPREVLAGLIDTARYAPSGHNSQPVHWLVIEDRKEVERFAGLVIDWMRTTLSQSPQLAELWHFDLIVADWDRGIDAILRGAPHVIVAHAPKDLPIAGQNCSIALAHLELAAYSHGLGTCWAGWFQAGVTFHPPMTEALQLPEGHQSFGAMMIGYPRHRYSRIPLRNEPGIIWR